MRDLGEGAARTRSRTSRRPSPRKLYGSAVTNMQIAGNAMSPDMAQLELPWSSDIMLPGSRIARVGLPGRSRVAA